MDNYVNRILNYTKMSNSEYDIKKDIIDDLELIFELYCDNNDQRLHEIYLKYYIKNYMILVKIINNYMNTYKNYIDLLRNILKNFDNDVIKKILNKIFVDYYINRNKCIWCIDNLYEKYDISRYNFIKKKYGIIKN